MGISSKNRILNMVHKRTVDGILIFSGFCSMLLVYKVYNYVVNVRPIIKEMRFKAEQDLLSEGKASEEDFSAL